MTLVVAQQKGRIIAAVCDTGIFEHDVRLAIEQQLPKICVLSSDIAVGFSGSPDLALRHINRFEIPDHRDNPRLA
jgi:hypothetical protein